MAELFLPSGANYGPALGAQARGGFFSGLVEGAQVGDRLSTSALERAALLEELDRKRREEGRLVDDRIVEGLIGGQLGGGSAGGGGARGGAGGGGSLGSFEPSFDLRGVAQQADVEQGQVEADERAVEAMRRMLASAGGERDVLDPRDRREAPFPFLEQLGQLGGRANDADVQALAAFREQLVGELEAERSKGPLAGSDPRLLELGEQVDEVDRALRLAFGRMTAEQEQLDPVRPIIERNPLIDDGYSPEVVLDPRRYAADLWRSPDFAKLTDEERVGKFRRYEDWFNRATGIAGRQQAMEREAILAQQASDLAGVIFAEAQRQGLPITEEQAIAQAQLQLGGQAEFIGEGLERRAEDIRAGEERKKDVRVAGIQTAAERRREARADESVVAETAAERAAADDAFAAAEQAYRAEVTDLTEQLALAERRRDPAERATAVSWVQGRLAEVEAERSAAMRAHERGVVEAAARGLRPERGESVRKGELEREKIGAEAGAKETETARREARDAQRRMDRLRDQYHDAKELERAGAARAAFPTFRDWLDQEGLLEGLPASVDYEVLVREQPDIWVKADEKHIPLPPDAPNAAFYVNKQTGQGFRAR